MDETTIDASDYERYCGPAALADLLDIPRSTAARMLLGVQRNRGLVTAPGTAPEDIVLVLDMYGVGVELFSPMTGECIESAADCLKRALVTMPHRMLGAAEIRAAVQTVIDASPAESQAQLAEHYRRRHDGKPVLQEWMEMHDGTWLVIVEDERQAHWVYVDDHCIDVRDSEYKTAPVLTALRVTRGLHE